VRWHHYERVRGSRLSAVLLSAVLPPSAMQGPPPAGLQGPPPAGLQGPPPAGLQGPPPTGLQGPPPTGLQGPPPSAQPAAAPAAAPAASMWKYLDDEGASQGPYTTEQINTWYLQGYMPADREVWRDTGVVGEMPDFVKLGAVPELVAPAAGKVAEAFAQQQLYMQQQMMMMKKQQELAAGLAATVALKRDVHEVPCKFFLQGTCRKGDSCRFAHIVGAEIPPDPRVAEELRAKLLRESMAEYLCIQTRQRFSSTAACMWPPPPGRGRSAALPDLNAQK
jgi:hypothetical protein